MKLKQKERRYSQCYQIVVLFVYIVQTLLKCDFCDITQPFNSISSPTDFRWCQKYLNTHSHLRFTLHVSRHTVPIIHYRSQTQFYRKKSFNSMYSSCKFSRISHAMASMKCRVVDRDFSQRDVSLCLVFIVASTKAQQTRSFCLIKS